MTAASSGPRHPLCGHVRFSETSIAVQSDMTAGHTNVELVAVEMLLAHCPWRLGDRGPRQPFVVNGLDNEAQRRAHCIDIFAHNLLDNRRLSCIIKPPGPCPCQHMGRWRRSGGFTASESASPCPSVAPFVELPTFCLLVNTVFGPCTSRNDNATTMLRLRGCCLVYTRLYLAACCPDHIELASGCSRDTAVIKHHRPCLHRCRESSRCQMQALVCHWLEWRSQWLQQLRRYSIVVVQSGSGPCESSRPPGHVT